MVILYYFLMSLSKSKIKIGSNRNFGIVFFLVFFIIAFWSFRGDFSEIKTLSLCISLIFLILGLINSKLLTPLNRLWFKFGIFLGNIVAPIVMGIIFFLVVTPIGFLMTILGKDLLGKKFNKNKNSYWIKKNKSSGTMKQQF